MPCIPCMHDITSLYPVGTATIVAIATKKDIYTGKNIQSYRTKKPLWLNDRVFPRDVAYLLKQVEDLLNFRR